jgi:hypothetical protein
LILTFHDPRCVLNQELQKCLIKEKNPFASTGLFRFVPLQASLDTDPSCRRTQDESDRLALPVVVLSHRGQRPVVDHKCLELVDANIGLNK